MVKTLNPTAAIALQKLQLLLQRNHAPKLAKLKGVITEMAMEADWEQCEWKPTFSKIVRKSLPEDYDAYLTESRKNIMFENSYQFCNQINEYNELLELMDIPLPTDRQQVQVLLKAVGKAVKSNKVNEAVMRDLVADSQNQSYKQVVDILRKLEASNAKARNLTEEMSILSDQRNKETKQQSQQGGPGDRTKIVCHHCKLPGHKIKNCKEKLYGKLCPKNCGRRAHDFSKHECRTRTTRTKRVYDSEDQIEMVECRLTATREQDSLPILTQTKMKAKHGNLAVWMFLDPGSGKSLISEQFYL